MLWPLVAIFLVLWSILSRWKRRKMIALSKQLPTSGVALPFIKHSYMFLGTSEDRMKTFDKVGQQAIENGGIIGHWQGSRLFVAVADPAIAEVVLKTCLEKDDLVRFFKVLIGNGSIFAPVDIWRHRRKILAPTFSPKNLIAFVDVFARQSGIMVDHLTSVAGKGPFSMRNFITNYSMDTVCETTLGVKIDAQSQPVQPFPRAFDTYYHLDSERICQPWFYNDIIYRFFRPGSYKLRNESKELVWNFMENIISAKREIYKSATREVPQNGLKTFLELLIESSDGNKGYSNVELREETLVIVVAGTDTSAIGTAFATLMLAKYPDVQEKVYQELQDVFGNSTRPLTSGDLHRLKYLDVVIKETLRLYPPVPVIIRSVEKDVTLPSGVTLVPGCGVLVSIWSIHRNRHYWGEDADLFRPERFLDTPLSHPAAFMPFSYGPRNCIGYPYAMMSMKTSLASLLRQFRLTVDNDVYNDNKLRVEFDITLRDVHNFVIQLDLRK